MSIELLLELHRKSSMLYSTQVYRKLSEKEQKLCDMGSKIQWHIKWKYAMMYDMKNY